jgi:hypothetical protein
MAKAMTFEQSVVHIIMKLEVECFSQCFARKGEDADADGTVRGS